MTGLVARGVERRHRARLAAVGGDPVERARRIRREHDDVRRAPGAPRPPLLGASQTASARPPATATVFSLSRREETDAAAVRRPERQGGAVGAARARLATSESSDRTQSWVRSAGRRRRRRPSCRPARARRSPSPDRGSCPAAPGRTAAGRPCRIAGRDAGQKSAATTAVSDDPGNGRPARARTIGRGRAPPGGRPRRPARLSSSSSLASPIALSRRFGSFSRQRRSSRRTEAGRSAGNASHCGSSSGRSRA